MRKHILSMLSLFAVIAMLSSCGAQRKDGSYGGNSSNTSLSGPSASQWKNGVKGTWVLNSVTREDIPQSYTIKNIFDEAPVDCFIGSTWNLPTGNHKGSITFNAEGTLCANGAVRTIIWSIFNPKDMGGQPEFQFKKLYAGDKAANVTTGYRLGLSYTDGQTLVMRMPVDLNGTDTGYLVFNFSRAIQ